MRTMPDKNRDHILPDHLLPEVIQAATQDQVASTDNIKDLLEDLLKKASELAKQMSATFETVIVESDKYSTITVLNEFFTNLQGKIFLWIDGSTYSNLVDLLNLLIVQITSMQDKILIACFCALILMVPGTYSEVQNVFIKIKKKLKNYI